MNIFSINGRMGRGNWWIIQLGMLVLGIVVNYFFQPPIPTREAELEKLKADPALALQFVQSLLGSIPITIGVLILNTWLFITASVQRLHDRGSSGWRILFWYVPLLIVVASFYVLIAYLNWTLFIGGLLLAAAGTVLAFVWLLVECGMLSGDDFENEYGEPPNAGARKASFEQELRQMLGEPEPAAMPHKSPIVSVRPAVSFAAPNAKPTFGRR
jgi:uncharacterized membrane protein YhaH (DUF805 family)